MNKISRADAVALGLKRYFTGVPCAHGHVAERATSNKTCWECIREKQRANRLNDPVSARERAKLAYEQNREVRLVRNREYKALHKERLRLRYLEHRRENFESVRARETRNYKRRMASDVVFVVKTRIRSLVKQALLKKGFAKSSKTAAVLGCSWDFFAAHIERQFLPGMSWDNRPLWHIDHIVPLATAVTEADVLALNHFTNLRPLWSADNLKKGAKQTHLI